MLLQAILNAPFPSETSHCDELSLAYGSRAITLFHVKSFESSLFDANRSLELLPTVELLFYKIFSLTSLKRFAESKQLVEEMTKRVESKMDIFDLCSPFEIFCQKIFPWEICPLPNPHHKIKMPVKWV